MDVKVVTPLPVKVIHVTR